MSLKPFPADPNLRQLQIALNPVAAMSSLKKGR